jgi:carbonic anhydrase
MRQNHAMPLSRTAQRQPFPADRFADVIAANQEYALHYASPELSGTAARGLAVVTCMDSRIDPLNVLGMHPGDVKILRNAGARVTDDMLRTLILATHLLGVKRVLVMPHTDCRMAQGLEHEIHEAIRQASGIDTRSIEFRTVTDQVSAVVTDVVRIRSHPLLRDDIVVGAAILDIKTGRLSPVEA